MRTVFTQIDVLAGIGASGPTSTQQKPRACGNFSVCRLPLFHSINGKQKIRVLLNVGGHIYYTRQTYKFLWIDTVYAVIGLIFAADPVDGRVEMGARVLAGLKAIPIPGRATLVIMGKLPDAKRRSVVPLRRQRQQRSLLAERLGQINNPQPATI